MFTGIHLVNAFLVILKLTSSIMLSGIKVHIFCYSQDYVNMLTHIDNICYLFYE